MVRLSLPYFGHAVRAIKNKLTRDFEKAEKRSLQAEIRIYLFLKITGAELLWLMRLFAEIWKNGSVMSGPNYFGLISKEETVKNPLKDIYYGAAERFNGKQNVGQITK